VTNEVPLTLTIHKLYQTGEIEARYTLDDAGHLPTLMVAVAKVNAEPVTLTIGDGTMTFEPGTLMLMSVSCNKADRVKSYRAVYQYHTAGLNRVLVPGQGYRDVTPPPYAASDFAGFREVHEGLVWTLVRK